MRKNASRIIFALSGFCSSLLSAQVAGTNFKIGAAATSIQTKGFLSLTYNAPGAFRYPNFFNIRIPLPVMKSSSGSSSSAGLSAVQALSNVNSDHDRCVRLIENLDFTNSATKLSISSTKNAETVSLPVEIMSETGKEIVYLRNTTTFAPDSLNCQIGEETPNSQGTKEILPNVSTPLNKILGVSVKQNGLIQIVAINEADPDYRQVIEIPGATSQAYYGNTYYSSTPSLTPEAEQCLYLLSRRIGMVSAYMSVGSASTSEIYTDNVAKVRKFRFPGGSFGCELQ
jgi:hypothetical protein